MRKPFDTEDTEKQYEKFMPYVYSASSFCQSHQCQEKIMFLLFRLFKAFLRLFRGKAEKTIQKAGSD
jgi:hypothetical protein